MTDIPEKLKQSAKDLREALRAELASCGRAPGEASFLPVTKNHPAELLVWLHQLGFEAVGENRVQEAADKKPLAPEGLRIELIGHLQSNKVAAALTLFDRIQSVDSTKLIDRINRLCPPERAPYPILLQVNAGEDEAKFGVDPEQAEALLTHALNAENLRVEGLMTIAPFDDNPETARRCFARLREIRDALRERTGADLYELSMGMSGDWREAIREGSTQIRVGTALVGARPG